MRRYTIHNVFLLLGAFLATVAIASGNDEREAEPWVLTLGIEEYPIVQRQSFNFSRASNFTAESVAIQPELRKRQLATQAGNVQKSAQPGDQSQSKRSQVLQQSRDQSPQANQPAFQGPVIKRQESNATSSSNGTAEVKSDVPTLPARASKVTAMIGVSMMPNTKKAAQTFQMLLPAAAPSLKVAGIATGSAQILQATVRVVPGPGGTPQVVAVGPTNAAGQGPAQQSRPQESQTLQPRPQQPQVQQPRPQEPQALQPRPQGPQAQPPVPAGGQTGGQNPQGQPRAPQQGGIANGVPQAVQPPIAINPGSPVAGPAPAAMTPSIQNMPAAGQQGQGLAGGPAPPQLASTVTLAGPANAGNNQGQGLQPVAGGTITVTVNGGNGGNNGAARATGVPNVPAIPATISIRPGGQQGGAANGGNNGAGQAAGGLGTVTIRPGGAGNQGVGAAGSQNAGNQGAQQTISIRPQGSGGNVAAGNLPQGLAGAQGPEACNCNCVCKANSFQMSDQLPQMGAMPPPPGGNNPAGMIGINPGPSIVSTTLATQASNSGNALAGQPLAGQPTSAPQVAPQNPQLPPPVESPVIPPTPTTTGVPALAAMTPGQGLAGQLTVSGGGVLPLQSAVTVPLLGRMFHIGPVEVREEMVR
ncbi:hypothetical protein EJ08DRAFT_656102 [Tothia fuscella]|uniref:Uncharacterized protein n=1 Tax=Tothia fuscella TaxID=1048955 RepID=A0A9P4P1K6_9PEZI|nr:hypothetical protein EJ08DRAFT_656102 [Tothia fuscella]